MKCKKCGSPITIDGTHLAPPSRDVLSSPRPAAVTTWSLAEPTRGAREVALEELVERYLAGALEPGTLVRAPGEAAYLPPYDQPALRARGAPRPESSRSTPAPRRASKRDEALSFSDETKALSPEEAATLKELASQTEVAIPEPFEDQTPVRSAFDEPPPNSFFDDHDVEAAMRSFETVYTEPPAAASSRVLSRPHEAPTAPTPLNVDEPPSAASLLAQPSRTPPPAARVSSKPPLPPPPSSRPRPSDGAPEVRRSSGPPRPPSPPSASRPPTPPPSSPAPVSSRPAPRFPYPAPGPATQTAPPLELPPNRSLVPARTTSRPPRPARSKAPLVLALLVLGVLIAAALVGWRRPDLLRSLGARLGHGPTSAPFDEVGANGALAEHARQTFACAMPNGPTGLGRVNVLVEPSGGAKSARVSPPFENTAVGECVVRHFEMLTLTPFSGPSVLLQTTFEVPADSTGDVAR